MDALWGEDVIALQRVKMQNGVSSLMMAITPCLSTGGPYAQLANKVDGKTYYGIGEWIMNPRMANIPVEEYMETGENF